MARFLFRAQDRNMTNGDFAFFTFYPGRAPLTDAPWTFYVRDKHDLLRRRQAFYVVKQVRAILFAYNAQSLESQLQIQIQMGICRARLTNCPGALTNVRMLCETGKL